MDFNDLPFGKYFSDHMLEAIMLTVNGKLVSIKPYQPISFEPSMMALHYGQAIFEGIKAIAIKTAKLLYFVRMII